MFSEFTTVRDAVEVLKPIAEEARQSGNLQPAEILKSLEAKDEDTYSPPLGESVRDAEAVLKAVDLPSGKSW